MIKIIHGKRTRSARVIWLLEELGVPYELQPMEFKPELLRAPAHLALHPLGLLPVVQTDGVTFFESGAIVEYLLEKYGRGRLAPPPATPERALYLQWFHYGEASLATHVSSIVRQRFGTPAVKSADVLEDARVRFVEAATVVDEALRDRPYICGEEFSAADIMVSYGLVMSRITRELPTELANIAAYLERLKQRPGYAKAWA